MLKLALDGNFTDFRHECLLPLQILFSPQSLRVLSWGHFQLPNQHPLLTLMVQLSLTLNSVGCHLKIDNQPSYIFFLLLLLFCFGFCFCFCVCFCSHLCFFAFAIWVQLQPNRKLHKMYETLPRCQGAVD